MRPSSRSRPVYSGCGGCTPAVTAGECQSVTSQITTSWSPWLTGSPAKRSSIQPRLSSCGAGGGALPQPVCCSAERPKPSAAHAIQPLPVSSNRECTTATVCAHQERHAVAGASRGCKAAGRQLGQLVDVPPAGAPQQLEKSRMLLPQYLRTHQEWERPAWAARQNSALLQTVAMLGGPGPSGLPAAPPHASPACCARTGCSCTGPGRSAAA